MTTQLTVLTAGKIEYDEFPIFSATGETVAFARVHDKFRGSAWKLHIPGSEGTRALSVALDLLPRQTKKVNIIAYLQEYLLGLIDTREHLRHSIQSTTKAIQVLEDNLALEDHIESALKRVLENAEVQLADVNKILAPFLVAEKKEGN